MLVWPESRLLLRESELPLVTELVRKSVALLKWIIVTVTVPDTSLVRKVSCPSKREAFTFVLLLT